MGVPLTDGALWFLHVVGEDPVDGVLGVRSGDVVFGEVAHVEDGSRGATRQTLVTDLRTGVRSGQVRSGQVGAWQVNSRHIR